MRTLVPFIFLCVIFNSFGTRLQAADLQLGDSKLSIPTEGGAWTWRNSCGTWGRFCYQATYSNGEQDEGTAFLAAGALTNGEAKMEFGALCRRVFKQSHVARRNIKEIELVTDGEKTIACGWDNGRKSTYLIRAGRSLASVSFLPESDNPKKVALFKKQVRSIIEKVKAHDIRGK